MKATPGERLVDIFECVCEEQLFQPTIIYDYPVEISPLSKNKPGEPEFVERFEIFAAGMEIGNAYTELNDPQEQRRRFQMQLGMAAAAVRRYRARLSAARHRNPAAGANRLRRAKPDGFNPHGLQRRLGHDYRIFQLANGGETRKLGIGLPDGTMISANVLPDRPAAAVSGRPLDDDAAVCRHQRHPARPVGGARVDRATVVLRQGRREFQPQRRRGAASRTRAGGNPLGRDARSIACASASPA